MTIFGFLNLSNVSKSGMATKGDEYVPETVPIKSATANHLIDCPPKSTKATNMKIIVKELFKDLVIVCVTAPSAISLRFL